MDKIVFKQHLDEATIMLIDFSKQLCYNDFAETYKYIITPEMRITDNDDRYMNDKEIAVLRDWNKYENKLLEASQIVDLFNQDGKLPVWIDMSVYETRPSLTIIDLFCCTRLRDDDELYYQGQIMPFHLQVAIPPNHLKVEKDGKFDINWKKLRDMKQKPNKTLTKLRRFLGLGHSDLI